MRVAFNLRLREYMWLSSKGTVSLEIFASLSFCEFSISKSVLLQSVKVIVSID